MTNVRWSRRERLNRWTYVHINSVWLDIASQRRFNTISNDECFTSLRFYFMMWFQFFARPSQTRVLSPSLHLPKPLQLQFFFILAFALCMHECSGKIWQAPKKKERRIELKSESQSRAINKVRKLRRQSILDAILIASPLWHHPTEKWGFAFSEGSFLKLFLSEIFLLWYIFRFLFFGCLCHSTTKFFHRHRHVSPVNVELVRRCWHDDRSVTKSEHFINHLHP